VKIMPVYDDPDYEWKQMVKKNDICDPYEKSIREFKEEFERIEKKLKQTGR
jgi:protein-tyrosine-phosphatase